MGLHHVILMTSFLQLQPSASMTVVPTLPGKLFPPLVFVAKFFPQMQFAVEYPGRIDTLDQRIKPTHAESVFYLGCVQLDRLHVAGLSCCVRLCLYMRVQDSELLLLLCVCV